MTGTRAATTLSRVEEAHFAGFRVSICGVAELGALEAQGVTHVLSLLDPGWAVPDAIASLGARGRLDLRFHDIVDALPGLRAPRAADVEALLTFARDATDLPDAHVLVHCQMGLSRSSAALALVLAQAKPGAAATDIFDEILRLRPRAWPNLRIIELGDAMLGRRGEMIAALGRCYRARIEGRPMLADAMIEMGRGRELAVALGV